MNILKRYLCVFGLMGMIVLSGCGDDDGGGESPVMLVAPSLDAASSINGNSFRVTWRSVEGANSYLVDVATDQQFSSIVEPYNSWRENGTGLNVENLMPTTTYFVRARAVMGSEISENSNIISVTTTEEEPDAPETPLKNAATTFSVGVAVNSDRVGAAAHAEVYEREFNQITAEWEMKMNIMYPSEGNFDFTRADKIVDYAVANGIEVHGHALIWHNATPSWVENFSGTDAEFETMIEDYITTTVTRYKGKVRSWDVVNEAFEDNSGALRNSVFRQKMGDDYIAKCHQWVRNADPDVKIFYNDYNMTFDETKQNATFNMADDFKTRGIPLDGIGFQMHISYNGPSKSQIENSSRKVTDRGLLLHFSELDVRANPNNDITFLTPQRAEAQQAKVEEVVRIYNAIPEASKFALTVWGLRDNETWLIDFWGNPDWPLLFDTSFNLKKAHTGFLQGLEN